jgi:hypothetical protein
VQLIAGIGGGDFTRCAIFQNSRFQGATFTVRQVRKSI